MATVNKQVLLRSRPMGMPTPDNFEFVETPVPQRGEGQVLCRTIFLSLDPYMRGRMSGMKSYADPVPMGSVMCGGTVSEVVESGSPQFHSGDYVLGYDGWQEYAVSDASALEKLPANPFPLSYYLGVLGMPGETAYVGLLDVGQPKPGETVVVSAAAGAVGSVVGQIAKLKGCRAVGTAGSDDKCRYVVEELGFDACVNYKTQLRTLKKACPNGIDVYFDNVAGDTLAMVLRLINIGARIPLIGLISEYNATEFPHGPDLMPVLVKRAKIQGMIVSDHADRRGDFLRDVSLWLQQGKIKYREHVVTGLENAPQAFIGLFSGQNFGKLLVKVASE